MSNSRHRYRALVFSRPLGGQTLTSCTLGLGLLLSSSAAQAWSQDASTDASSRIIGGDRVKTCGFPSTITMDQGGMGCSATLVHPKLVFTAAHCMMHGGKPRKVHFGERRFSRSRTAKVERCVSHPSWAKTKEVGGTDIAYCVLAEEVTDVPITPILMGCEIEALQPGAPVVLAGFGRTTPPWSSQESQQDDGGLWRDGVKHWVETRYIRTFEEGELKAGVVGAKGKQGCQGDSGGPVFVKLPEDKFGKDAGWRVFGVTSGQDDGGPECQTGEALYAMMHEWIEVVEKETGLDVTPCFDADGTWNPGPDCHSAPLSLDTVAGGSWPSSCESGPVSGKITTCGKQPDADEDKDSGKDKDGSGKDGAGDKDDGAGKDEEDKDGAGKDEEDKDGAGKDEEDKDGAGKDGAGKDGAGKDGSDKDGSDEKDDDKDGDDGKKSGEGDDGGAGKSPEKEKESGEDKEDVLPGGCRSSGSPSAPWSLLGFGLAGLFGWKRKRRR